MGYISQTYDPFIIADTNTTLDRVHELSDLAFEDIFPDESYSNFETQIWVVMRKLIDKTIDSRNHYKKDRKLRQNSQDLHAL